MEKWKKLKVGIIISSIILAVAFILDDVFYYSQMHIAESMVFPIAFILLVPILLFMILPFFDKNKPKKGKET